MKRRVLMMVACIFGWALAISAQAADDDLQLTVSAGGHDRANTPITVLVDAPEGVQSVSLTDPKGATIPAQLTALGLRNSTASGKSELHFVFPSLAKGQSVKLKARFTTARPTSGFAWAEEADQYSELSYNGRPVMRYMCLKLTDENRDDAFKVYHHLYDPAGTRFVTKGPGSRYTHHRGLFFGYCDVSYSGGEANTWSGRNTPQTHGGYRAQEAGPVLGRHRVQVDWRGAKDVVYLKEERELAVYHIADGVLVEFTTRCATTGDQVILDGNAPHAGFQFRAAGEVAEETEKQTYYLRPDGKGEMGQARAKAFDLPWDAISFVAGGKRYTVVYLDRPDNPKPAEYNERSYGRFGSFFRYELNPGQDLQANYRVWLQDGEITGGQADSLSADFVEPPKVTIP